MDNLMQNLTPEEQQRLAEEMRKFASSGDPQAQMLALQGQQDRISSMGARPLQVDRAAGGGGGGRQVVGAISPLEVAGNVAQNVSAQYQQKQLNDEYKNILGKSDAARGDYAAAIADALRRQGTIPFSGQ